MAASNMASSKDAALYLPLLLEGVAAGAVDEEEEVEAGGGLILDGGTLSLSSGLLVLFEYADLGSGVSLTRGSSSTVGKEYLQVGHV